MPRPRHTRPLTLEALEARWLPSTSIPLSGTAWTALGPAPIINGQTQFILPNDPPGYLLGPMPLPPKK